MSGAHRIHVLGVRHHGPGSARMVERALEALKPDAVLIEGPPDAAGVIGLAAGEEMRPPVALLVYEPERPRSGVFYPFAVFSPEWRAIHWGLKNKAEVRFIDLPLALRAPSEEKAGEEADEKPAGPVDEESEDEDDGEEADEAKAEAVRRADPLEEFARAAGFEDGEAWWGRLIEERRGSEDPVGVFDAIREAMASARELLAGASHDKDEPAREAHMRKSIRAAVKEGFERIAVVCGAWHAPVLTSATLKQFAAKSDDEIIKALPKRKTTATWIPWTYDRLALFSGYGAGVGSPGWYEHLWVSRDKVSEGWLTKVARLMRDEDLDASPASVIEAVRLAESLAALRGRSIAGLDELGEATLAILCHGNPMPMRVIERKLIVSQRLGEVPEGAPSVPLQRDLAALQKSLRLKVSAVDTELDLDQRKEMDLARSRLLHRLALLKINWGKLQDDQRQRTSTFHEVWKLQWRPELSVAVIVAARWGNTVQDAAGAYTADRAMHATDLIELTTMLDDVMLADLPQAVTRIINRVQELSAVSTDIGHLMEAVPPLVGVLRYGDVRKTDAALVRPVVGGMIARICAGLLPACGLLDDDAAKEMQGRIDGVHAALTTLADAELLDPWKEQIARLGDIDVHGLVAGRCWRLLLDAGATTPEEAATRLSLGLSRGNDPAKASAWLEGFLSGSGMVLVHDERLLSIIDRWVVSLSNEAFEAVCPLARRTFSTFDKPERRHIGEKLRRGVGAVGAKSDIATDDYDPVRGALVEPVLRLILGERYV